jgi:hypothetical protein
MLTEQILKEAVVSELLINRIIEAARMRKQPTVNRKYVEEALRQIDAGQEVASRFPSGQPSLAEIYKLAASIQAAAKAAMKN